MDDSNIKIFSHMRLNMFFGFYIFALWSILHFNSIDYEYSVYKRIMFDLGRDIKDFVDSVVIDMKEDFTGSK